MAHHEHCNLLKDYLKRHKEVEVVTPNPDKLTELTEMQACRCPEEMYWLHRSELSESEFTKKYSTDGRTHSLDCFGCEAHCGKHDWGQSLKEYFVYQPKLF